VPNILQYYIPGACFLFVFQLTISKKLSGFAFNVGCCIISYVSLATIALLRLNILKHLKDTSWINNGISIILCIIVALLLSLILSNKKVKNWIANQFHITTNNNVLDDVFDYTNGSCVIARLKDKDYFFMGNLRLTDEGKDKQYIVLNAFTKFSQNGSVLATYTRAEGQENANIVLKISDIDYLEVYNNGFEDIVTVLKRED
jgi:hypothetical protein